MQKFRNDSGMKGRRKTASGLGSLGSVGSNSRYRRRSRFGWLRNIHYRWPFAIPAAAALLLVILGIAIIPGLVNGKSDAKANGKTLTANAAPEPTAAPAVTPAVEATPTAAAEPSATPEPAATSEPAATPETSAAEEEDVTDNMPAAIAPAEIMGIDGPLVTMVREYEKFDNKYTTDVALGLPECPRVDDSYFDDTVFIGDSVSEKLKYYVTQQRKENPTLLGNAVFLTAPSLSARNTLKDVTETSLHPVYRGKKMKLEDIVAEMGVKKVYIMFGLNDVGISGAKESAKNLMTLIKKIRKESPEVLIFIQSATPRVKGEKPTNKALYKFNMRVYKYCLKLEEQGVYFVDVAHVMRDENGKLFREYCSDLDSMALHFNNKACQVWIDYLYTHALVAQ